MTRRVLLVLLTVGATLAVGVLGAPLVHADPTPPPPTPHMATEVVEPPGSPDLPQAVTDPGAPLTGAPTSAPTPSATSTPAAPAAPSNSSASDVCSAAVQNLGGLAGAAGALIGCPAAGAAAATISFITDPLGYIAAALSGAATWLMEQVSLFANNATQPDLTSSWWIDAYQKAMAIGVMLFCLVLLYEIVLWATGRVTPRQMGETFQLWVPAFLGGILFGPALAQFLINGSGALADGIIHAMPGFGGGDAFKAITGAVSNAGGGEGAAEGTAQAIMAIVEAIAVLIAAFVVFLMLCLQTVILYLVGALFPITWVWIVSHRHRDHAWKAPTLVAAIIFGKAVLFFAVGVAMAIATAAVAVQGKGAGADFALVVMGAIAMLLAAFTPWWLVKLIGIMPSAGGSGVADGAGSAAGGAARSAGHTGRNAVKAGGIGAAAGGSLARLAAKSRNGDTGNVVGAGSRGWWKPPSQSSTSKAAGANATGSGGQSSNGAAATGSSGSTTAGSNGAAATAAPGSSKGSVTPAPVDGSSAAGKGAATAAKGAGGATAPRSPAGRMGRPNGPKHAAGSRRSSGTSGGSKLGARAASSPDRQVPTRPPMSKWVASARVAEAEFIRHNPDASRPPGTPPDTEGASR